MARPYSSKLIRYLKVRKGSSLGATLGKLCVEYHLSAAHVAITLDVTPATVHSWFRGQGVSEKNRDKVEALITSITKDKKTGYLPTTSSESKAYFEKL